MVGKKLHKDKNILLQLSLRMSSPTSTSPLSSSTISTSDTSTITSDATLSTEGISSTSTVSASFQSSPISENEIENFILKMNKSSSNFDDFQPASSNEDDDAYIIPIRIILPVVHVHAIPENSTFTQYNYIILQTNDTSYHQHVDTDKSDILIPEDRSKILSTLLNVLPLNETAAVTTTEPKTMPSTTDGNDISSSTESKPDIRNSSSNNSKLSNNNNSENSIRKEPVILFASDGFRYQRGKQYKIFNDVGDVVVEFEDIVPYRSVEITTIPPTARSTDESDAYNAKYDEHYGKILQWLSYSL